MNSLYGTPLSGMRGADAALDVTANNIANVNTGGYETVEPILGSLPSTDPIGPPELYGTTSAAQRVGTGVQPVGTMRSTAQPNLNPTGRPLDLAVSGAALLTLRRPDGTLVYTRQAALDVAPDGTLATGAGLTLSPAIRVPATVTHVQVDAHGVVSGLRADGRAQVLGQVRLTTFPAPENLAEQGEGQYVPTAMSGRPAAARTGAGASQVMSGYTLASTVDLATEMSNMIEEQRMYESNSKALQTLDSLINTIVTLQQRG